VPITSPDRLRADSARVRARMLEVARARVDAGDLDLPMNAIAKAAGVGVGTVYRHFPSRQALIEELAAASLGALTAEAVRAADDPDVAAALTGLLRAALHCLLTDPTLAVVLGAHEAACAGTIDLSRELLGAFLNLLDRARAAGVVRADLTGDDLRALICGLEHAVRVNGGEEAADRYLDMLVKGLRP
jgi:AcrR family transcriptional regulator